MRKLFNPLVIALVLCLILTLFGGCAVQPTTTATAATTASNATEDTSPMGKYEPGITMSFAVPFDETSDATALLKEKFNETLTDNRWTRYYKDLLGITLKFDLVAQGGDQYNQKIKLAMSSSSLPDFVKIYDLADLKNLVDAGQLAEIGPSYEKYASDLFRNITEEEGKLIFTPATYSSKIYGIPLKGTSTDGYNGLWLRQDWLDKLGLQRPKTMDDVMNLAKAFVSDDPDGNSKDDTFGMLLEQDFVWQSKGVFWAFGAYPNSPAQWLKNSEGKLVYANVQPEMKKGLEFLRTMYADGLVDKEFASKNFDKAFEPAVNGKIGMFYGPHWNAWAIDNVVKMDPKATWVSVPLPTGTGSPVKVPLTISTMGYAIATTKAEHPEALVKLCNAYVDKLFGPLKGVESGKFFAEGGYEFWGLSPLAILATTIDLQSHRDIKKATADGTLDKLTGTALDYYNFMQQGMLPWTLMFGVKDTPFNYIDDTYPGVVLWNEFNGAPTATMATRWSNMEELINSTFVKIINGQAELDSFDSMVTEWNAMGGEKVTQEVNDSVSK